MSAEVAEKPVTEAEVQKAYWDGYACRQETGVDEGDNPFDAHDETTLWDSWLSGYEDGEWDGI